MTLYSNAISYIIETISAEYYNGILMDDVRLQHLKLRWNC